MMRKSPSRTRSRRREVESSSNPPVLSTPPRVRRDATGMELYSAPTVDTLDDNGDTQRDLYYKGGTTPTTRGYTSSFTSADNGTVPRSSVVQISRQSSQRTTPTRASPMRTTASSSNSSMMPPRPPTVSSKTRSRSSTSSVRKRPKKPKSDRDFQHEQDAMRVRIRKINLSQRCAFEPTRLVSTKEWQDHVAAAEQVRKTSMKKKISPSLQHLELLHRLQRVSTVRQLDFTPSVGLESDVFVPWDDDLQPPEQRVVRPRHFKRDGRYRSIDPLKATMAVLPPHPPTLSNTKRRLPMRSDVGFPNASEKEILLKQKEINMESSWEEASPRLVVLVTSDFLGTAILDEPTQPLLEENYKWNGGGLEGMPLAGKELIMAKERNTRLFSLQHEKKKKPHAKKWKPQQTSMLAPPLDASYSSTMGWRPRPFHDRPPGRVHCLACPLKVSFEVGNVEPLVCSLALYSLPVGKKQKGMGFGKSSENFWFPAGDWEGLPLTLEAAHALAIGSTPTEVEESWKHRKHKAIFSYDPLVIERSNIYLVLQVQKVSQAGATSPYHVAKKSAALTSSPPNTPPRKKGLGGRIKSLRKIGKSSGGGGDRAEWADAETARQRSKAVYDMFGTQFLTPLCFGLSPLFPLNTSESEKPVQLVETLWPNGSTQDMQLYAFPPSPESQDEFVERLTAVALEERQSALASFRATGSSAVELQRIPSSDSSFKSVYTSITDEDGTPVPVNPLPPPSSLTSSTATPSVESSTTKKKSSSSRIFKSPKRSAGSHKSESAIHSTPIAGTASLFTSILGVDFVQSMLSTPHVLRPNGLNRLPRVLVDVSGDCAIMMNAHPAPSSTSGDATKKRSNLVRLPQSGKPSGYADASELREVLYLPPRADKQYGVDIPGSTRSLLNLLYLYPRLVRQVSDDQKKDDKKSRRPNKKHKSKQYSLRIRLVKTIVRVNQESGEAESIHQELESFHNPAPWAGPCMLKAVYTRIPDASSADNDNAKVGIAMQDEIKLRLPMVLDGSYFLEFTLFEVEFVDDCEDDGHETDESTGCGIAVDCVGEAMIPLSNSALREASSGVRIATVIPNGNHRVALGDFQLQLETRLVSSIHVNDATVATALRDFPYAKQKANADEKNVLKELALVPSRSIVGKTPSAEPLVDIKVPFHNIFASASESAVYSYFPLLVYMHLCNVVNRGAPELDLKRLAKLLESNNEGRDEGALPCSEDTKFITDNMFSLFEVIRKAKMKLQQYSSESDRQVQFFLKSFVDSFDEDLLSSQSNQEQCGENTSLEALHMERSQSYSSLETPDRLYGRSSDDTGDDDDLEDSHHAGAILRNKASTGNDADTRIFQTFSSTVDASGVPFSRVAYGASKTDRMRIEAEIYKDGARHLFDDDETVATFLTSKTTDRNRVDQYSSYASLDTKSWDPSDHGSILDKNSFTESPKSSQHEPRDLNETGSDELKQVGNSIADSALAKRVRTAAQVMIAPCMAPTLSTVLATGTGSPASKREHHVEDLKQNASARLGSAVYGAHLPHAVTVGDSAGPMHTPKAEDYIYTPGSDTDDEFLESDPTVASLRTPTLSGSKLRGAAQTLLLSPSVISPRQTDSIPYVYESLIILWLRAWLEYSETTSHNMSMRAKTIPKATSIMIIPVFDLSDPNPHPLFSFYDHMDMILPLCLKSFVLRCDERSTDSSSAAPRILDCGHLQILTAFVEMLARGLMGQALSGGKSRNEDETALLRALSSSQLVLEFLVGLIAVVHTEHISQLIAKYFGTLREYEPEIFESDDKSGNQRSGPLFAWTEDSLRAVRCSRQLRLHSVERLSVLPNFLALNYPLKITEKSIREKSLKTSWTIQSVDEQDDFDTNFRCRYPDGLERLPHTGWLADILLGESLSICSLSCEAVVNEAMVHVETSQKDYVKASVASSRGGRPGKSLKRQDLLAFQATAIQAITCAYELLLRRHAMDSRFQTERCRCRIAAVLAPCIMEKSLFSVRWLARMEATHKVRSLWLLCLIYVLQEAPESVIREILRSYCLPQNFLIHRFIRMLRLSSSTFQSFIDQAAHSTFPTMVEEGLSSWLLQESFNTLCAATNMLVDECVDPMSAYPSEHKKMAQGVLDLLLHMITAPQSSVTHLRALGGALQALGKFGVSLFLEGAGGSIQHWIRIVLTLMNSVSLSVRSIATDFVVSLLGAIFSLRGNIDEIALVFLTLMPEVVARELALFSVCGLLVKIEDVERAVWPLRRALADIEEANPLDDDRVDPQLVPVLATFCRACQAVIDGVLIELRLKGDRCVVVGSCVIMKPCETYIFDADEESLFEAATFFLPETAPLQRLRWLLTLKSLHESKGQWVEAAETLILCARTISDAIPHLRNVWRPSRFVLWYDERRSLWLSTIGKELGHPDRGNVQVMEFADSFLEPANHFKGVLKTVTGGKLQQPTVPAMCKMLTSVTKEAVAKFLLEDGMDELAFSRLESLLKVVMKVVDDHSAMSLRRGMTRFAGVHDSGPIRRRLVEENAALRKLSARLNAEMTQLAERMLLIVEDETETSQRSESVFDDQRVEKSNHRKGVESPQNWSRRPHFVRVLLSGKKPARFVESTTLPTFLEWDNPCICRIPAKIIRSVTRGSDRDVKALEERICIEFGKPLRDSLIKECGNSSILFRAGGRANGDVTEPDASTTIIDVSLVHVNVPATMNSHDFSADEDSGAMHNVKQFFYRKSSSVEHAPGKNGQQLQILLPELASSLVELTVAHSFPCALSRQRTLLTSEFLAQS